MCVSTKNNSLYFFIFYEGPKRCGPSQYIFCEGPDPWTLAGSTPMVATISYVHRVEKKRRHGFFCNKCRHSFVIFGVHHHADSFYQENRKFIPNIITPVRSDDVIVTSLETTLSRTAAGKDIKNFCLIT